MRTVLRRQPGLTVLLVLTAVAALALGPHIFAGGFHTDDWIDAGQERFHPGHGFLDAVRYSQTHQRDVWSVLRNLEFAVFGAHPAPLLALTVLGSVLACWMFFVVGRRFGAPVLPAGMAAIVLLLLPGADANRLWASGLMINLFSCAALLAGLLVALRGLEVGGRRGAAIHGGALVLYALSVNGYEIGAGVVLVFGVVYLAYAPTPRAALWRWAADAIVVLAILVRYTGRRTIPSPSLDYVIHHAHDVARGGLHRATQALLPVQDALIWPVLLPALAVIAGASFLAWRGPPAGEVRRHWRTGVMLIGGGALAAAASWLILLPLYAGYNPDSPGLANRINGVAAMGLVAGVAGVAVLVAVLVRAALGTRAPRVSVLVTALLVPLAIGNFIGLRSDAADYERAARESRALLARLHTLVPSPAAGTRMFTFGEPGYSAPSVNIFGGAGNQDLFYASHLLYDTPAVGAYPVLDGMRFTCSPATMTLNGASPTSTIAYGRGLLVNLPAGRVTTPRNQADCVRATEALKPYAPMVAPATTGSSEASR